MSALHVLTRALCLSAPLVWLAWGCGATCLRDSDCDDGLVCSRDHCVLPAQRADDAGPSSAGAAGSGTISAGGAGSGGTSAVVASGGGSGGRPPLPSSSAGGSATGGRENLDASAAADADSN